jgi:hypothetical protein
VHHPVLKDQSKFALLSFKNVRCDIPRNGLALPHDTYVITELPWKIDEPWRSWLGPEAEAIQGSNLVIARTATNGFSLNALPIMDETNERLKGGVHGILSMLRLLGTIEYETASMLTGFVQNGRVEIRQGAKLERYHITRGCLPWVIREDELTEAVGLADAKASHEATIPQMQKSRLWRGWVALHVALQQYYASDRLHGFVRALEALILPAVARTRQQFVSRCVVFAGPKVTEETRQALDDGYQMRCDVEHMHDWDRWLTTKYPGMNHEERENLAYWRTRQMETLACTAYKRIYLDSNLRLHFSDDAAIEGFWKKPESDIRTAFGNVFDITKLKLVKRYDPIGRALPSDWPKGWMETLQTKNA